MAKRTRIELGRRNNVAAASQNETKGDQTETTVGADKTPAAVSQSDADDAETSETSEAPKPGRPKGSKNRDYAGGERFPGMCPKCSCTDSKAEKKRTVKLTNDPQFSHVTVIRCQCVKCGQWRVDRQKCNPAD